MGWMHEDTAHEGWVVAVERREQHGWTRWSEIGMDDQIGEVPAQWVQVGCDCGWRSPRLVAPVGTVWAPCSVFFPDAGFDDAAHDLWREHHIDLLATAYGAFRARARTSSMSDAIDALGWFAA
jgi:hypothetical protein